MVRRWRVVDTAGLHVPPLRLWGGNGQGFSTEHPALDFPAGGLGPDNRFGIYIGDSWKVKPTLTLSAGLRYDRDTGRTDSDLPSIPEINALFPGLGNPVRQPNTNFLRSGASVTAPSRTRSLEPTWGTSTAA